MILFLCVCVTLAPKVAWTLGTGFGSVYIIKWKQWTFVKKGVDPSFNLFERSFWASPPFNKCVRLDYGSLKFVENIVQLCILIKDILIVDDYYKLNRIYFDKQCILVPCARHMVDISKKKPQII
jgi:hypothetical protein